MHAARSGNAMALSEVAEACKRTCNPQTVRSGAAWIWTHLSSGNMEMFFGRGGLEKY